MKECIKKVLLKAMQLQGIEKEVATLKRKEDDRTVEVKQLKENVAKLRKEIAKVRKRVSRNIAKIVEIRQFLHNNEYVKKYFVHPGHDPQGKRCDICKGREFGILDYRKEIASLLNEKVFVN